MKIGIFGGSFNPPHKMHKNIGINLVLNKYLDKVIYVPTGNNYNKSYLIDSKHRYNMLKLIINNYNDLELSDYEINNNLKYTYQTLDYFKKNYKNDEIYFICGSDNLKEITTWRNFEYILDNYKIVVIKRNNDDINNILSNINSKNIIIADIELDSISSTYIRANIKNKEEISELIDESVLKYIERNNLYDECGL